ncbi:TniQ family protein [Acidovorax soli]|uniref:TniQ family protein n=1 Tax=Acidovorax soli TaxID=592050 RepID=UPI0032B21BCA
MGIKLWPIHPQPLPDELLSSWMIRVARDNGFKVHSFYAAHFGRERQIWNRDIDHHAPAWLLDGLEAHTGVQRVRLEAMTLRAFESVVFERFNETGNTRFLMPLSIFHRTRRAYGQQFCPLCLSEDKTPYLRRRWRLALQVVCVKHGVLLQDRCGSCGSPLVPHRADMHTTSTFPQRNTLRQCGHCRGSVIAAAVQVPRETIDTQRCIDRVLDQGFATLLNQDAVYSHLYFDGLRQLMIGLVALDAFPGQSGSFERAGVGDRLQRLQAAVALADDWPNRFLSYCSQVKKPYAAFTKDAAEIPYWLASVLRQQLLARSAPLYRDEAEAIVTASERITGRSDISTARLLSGRSIEHALARPCVSDDTADMLVASLDQEVSRSSGGRRALLLRDKVMFITARCMHLTAPQLLALDPMAFGGANCAQFSFWDRIDTSARAAAMLSWYLDRLRPQLLQGTCAPALFIGQGGAPLKPNAVSSRFTRAVLRANLNRMILNWDEWVRDPYNQVRVIQKVSCKT